MSLILVVEDNKANLKLMSGILLRAQHQVVFETRADVAIETAEVQRPDLIVMDIQLPGMDGVTATRHLRENPKTREVPILAVTAHAMAGDAERILDAGCDAYIAKPISYRLFLAEVARLLDGAAQLRQVDAAEK